MTHDEKISQMARYMEKHGSRTEYDMRTGKSVHKPATMSFEDFRKSEKKPSPARSKALEKKMSHHQKMEAKGLRYRPDVNPKKKGAYVSNEVDEKTGKYKNTY